MSRQLKVYNRFEELILNVRFVAGDPLPLQIEDGTPELQTAVSSLIGRDFDETVVVGNQRQHFEAKWGTAEYLDALAGYWSSNFGWQTRIVETAPMLWNLPTQSLVENPAIFYKAYIGPTEYNSQVWRNHYQSEELNLVYFGGFDLTNATGASGVENLGVTLKATSQSGNLFLSQTKPQSIFNLQPLQQSFDMSQVQLASFSLAWAISQPTTTVLLKEHDPSVTPSIRVQDALAA